MTASDSQAPAFDPQRLDAQICFPLYAATNLLQRLYRPLLSPLGLTYSQYLVMLVLWERDAAHVGDLMRCLHLDTGTMTPLLKRMETAGLIVRRRDVADERRVSVALTEHGRALKARAAHVPAALAGRIDMTLADATDLHRLTRTLVGRLAEAAAV